MRASKSRSTKRGVQAQSPENFWKKRLNAKTLVTTPTNMAKTFWRIVAFGDMG
jgi:hypothetical protein